MKWETLRHVTPVILLAALAIAQPLLAQIIQGDVKLVNGSPPPKPVAIERICSGARFPQGTTDSQGHFRLELGRLSSPIADASSADSGQTLTNPGEALSVTQKAGGAAGSARIAREAITAESQGCELWAVLSGYHPVLIDMSGTTGSIRDSSIRDVGTIVLRPKLTPQELKARDAAAERAGTTSASPAPQTKLITEADRSLAKVRQALKENKPAEAQRELEHLVELEPTNAGAWYQLGLLYAQEDRRADAIKSYQSAIAADATLVGPYAMLASLQAQGQQWKELAETTEKLIQVNPVDVPAAYYYKTVAYYNLVDLDAAEKAARDGIQIDTQHRVPRLHHLLGHILADDRKFEEAAEQMKLYLRYAPDAKDRDEAQKLADEWGKLR